MIEYWKHQILIYGTQLLLLWFYRTLLYVIGGNEYKIFRQLDGLIVMMHAYSVGGRGFDPRVENPTFSKNGIDLHQQNSSWMLCGWDVTVKCKEPWK